MKTKKTYKIDGMHCPSCAMMIEGELEDRGITGQCSFATGIIEVEGEPDERVVKASVEAAGYTLVGLARTDK
ncbi:MAG TPA: heavy-metal-associated domain-containing protein [Patescibacteria group bacterium]|nr:heavy-metal-associated domain-containing protein [Patescibacteria group bacterium]